MDAQYSKINNGLDNPCGAAARSGAVPEWMAAPEIAALCRYLDDAKAQTALVMAGVPGAGKSSFLRILREKNHIRPEAYWLDPDATMKAMPEYRRDFAALGQDEAYARWELPARKAAYDGFEDARVMLRPIVIDMACARRENLEMVEALKEGGYDICMVHVQCPPQIAHARAMRRDRPMPYERIIERMDGIQELMPAFRRIADYFIALDNASAEAPYRPIA